MLMKQGPSVAPWTDGAPEGPTTGGGTGERGRISSTLVVRSGAVVATADPGGRRMAARRKERSARRVAWLRLERMDNATPRATSAPLAAILARPWRAGATSARSQAKSPLADEAAARG